MTSQLTLNLLRTLFVVFTTYMGVMVGESLVPTTWMGAAAGAAFGLTIVLSDLLLKGISLRLFSSATFGLLVGIILAKLLLASHVLANASKDVQWVTGLLVYATCAYFGMMLAIRSNRDEFSLIIPYVRFRRAQLHEAPLLIDTNIIIDGRLSSVSQTGFLSTSLVVPRFVLDELQRLADSADPAKRERGREGLSRLQKLQRLPNVSVAIHETEPDEGVPTDTRLVQLAKLLDTSLLTNDSNLCSLARLQGVVALNFNELAQAIRSALAMGDQLDLTLTKEGRDPHQAVGYLADGTMIVVNHARAHLGKTVPVTISGTLQTNAGRLLFAEIRGAETNGNKVLDG